MPQAPHHAIIHQLEHPVQRGSSHTKRPRHVARRLAALQQTARHLDLMCRQLRLPAYAAERIFLRKVGGYIFTHRLLVEYFATLEPIEQGGQAKAE